MTKSWPLLALALLGAVAAVFCLAAFDWTTWACRLPSGEEGKVLTPGVGGCIEYWLNRYQTLIGALVAVGAAAFAWRGVVMQVASAEKQVRIGRRQSAIALIEVLNSKFDSVRGLSHQVMFINQRDIDANHYRKVAIKSLVEMIKVAENPKAVRDEYIKRFELSMNSQRTCIAAIKKSLIKIDELGASSLVSSETREQIWHYTNLARHSLWTHEMAAAYISSVPSVFDAATTQARLLKMNELFENLAGITFFPALDTHPGYELARKASKNFAELLDNALQDAEGRIP